ncbi:MAG: hypothetical protein HFI70_03320 [Lachnospiraceae bacterium]|nr:hypothetical protein [Lachnospiraceae bacterium]
MTYGKFVYTDIQYGRCSRVADSCGSAAEVYSEKYAEKYALYFVGIRLSCPKACVLLTIYWFHPLCWAAYWMFCKDLDTLALGEANL